MKHKYVLIEILYQLVIHRRTRGYPSIAKLKEIKDVTGV